jgi:hypothetical protein
VQAAVRKLFLAATIFVAALITVAVVYRPLLPGGIGADFKVFWTAARVPARDVYSVEALTAVQNLPVEEAKPRPFISPPSLLVLLAPFGALGFWPAFALWTSLALAAQFLAARRILDPPALLLLALAPATHFALGPGQVTLFVGAAVLAAMTMLPRRPSMAGVLLAAAALIKPQAVMLVPIALAAGGNWRALASCAITGAAAGLACLAMQGPQLWRDWLAALAGFPDLLRDLGYLGRSLSPYATALDFGLTGSAVTVVVVAGIALGMVTCWRVFRATDNPALRAGALGCSYLLCTPYAMVYEAAMIVPAAAYLLASRDASPMVRGSAWLAICLPFLAAALPFFAVALMIAAGSRPAQAPIEAGA